MPQKAVLLPGLRLPLWSRMQSGAAAAHAVGSTCVEMLAIGWWKIHDLALCGDSRSGYGEGDLGMSHSDIRPGYHRSAWQLQKVAARHERRYYETGERMPVSIFWEGIGVPFSATAPCRMVWTNFCWLVICARRVLKW